MQYRFGAFELDAQQYELRRDGEPQPLEPQGFNVLLYLIEHLDRVVSKGELLDQLWPNQYVTEATLVQRLVAARRALGGSVRARRFIKPVHGPAIALWRRWRRKVGQSQYHNLRPRRRCHCASHRAGLVTYQAWSRRWNTMICSGEASRALQYSIASHL